LIFHHFNTENSLIGWHLVATEVISEAEEKFEKWRKITGYVLGPAVFLLLLFFPPAGLTQQGAHLAAVLSFALIWWMTEPVPIPITALLAPCLCVALSVADAKTVFAGFADPIVFLFIGSFMLAQAMMKHQLDRRIAMAILSLPWVAILSLPWVGSSAYRILLAFGFTATMISMFLSNTATTAMLLPIGLGILNEVASLMSKGGKDIDVKTLRFSTAMMLMLAYGASIGGLGTPIGTPPNLIGIGMIRDMTGVSISFFAWMKLALPAVALMFGVLYGLLIFLHKPEMGKLEGMSDYLSARKEEIGPWTQGQINTLIAFSVAVVLWIMPGLLAFSGPKADVYVRDFNKLLPEGVVAVFAAILLFLLPISMKRGEFTITWNEAVRIDWGTILLFGSGIALGSLAISTGLAKWLGSGILEATQVRSTAGITFMSIVLAVIVSEATSNTASATMVIPVAIAVAKAAEISPIAPALGACMGASYGFMLPVSTAPNAIVYGTGMVSIRKMAKTGIFFDLLGIIVIWVTLMILPLPKGPETPPAQEPEKAAAR
jgi:solute carrier family 13 (sodium-dependent dicarboxylate transporter), member 2/3/5